MRILVTGNAGSGKTTLAKQLGKQLSLPVYSLDSVVWKPGWQLASREERLQKENELAAKPSWVIEGVSTNIQRQADLVIFLDVPRSLCLFRCIKRNIPYLFHSRPELPDNCPEIKILPTLLKIIWNFPSQTAPAIKKHLVDSRDLVVRTEKDRKKLLGRF